MLSGAVRRRPANPLAGEPVRDGLVRELRSEAGSAYVPWAVCEAVDRDHAVIVAGSDVTATAVPTVVNRSWP